MQRLVGIPDNCNPDDVSVGVNYTNAVIRSGNIPVVLPRTTDIDIVKRMVSEVDSILLPGGCDIDPALFGEKPSPYLGEVNRERDDFEFLILDQAVKQHKHVFGICRGIQVINVFFGGTLYQDIFSELADVLPHQCPEKKWEPVHAIDIVEGSKIHQLLGTTHTEVNSTHHQAVKRLADGFRTTATSADGIVEAIESDIYNIQAVQFHPERLVQIDNPPFVNLFGNI